jgi:transposase
MNVSPLFVEWRGLQVEGVQVSAEGMSITMRTVDLRAQCPRCHTWSTRIHSRYLRRVADLPSHGRRVELLLHVRRFVCIDATCTQRIFCERLTAVAAAYAQRTQRLTKGLTALGVAVGGEPGARVATSLGMRTSPDTLLRQLRRAAFPNLPPPRVVGIDDWAKRRGQSYGTIVIDLERRRPIDLLPDRTAETVAQWLRLHPSVKLVSRDRAGAYADGARQGAPHAQQVADRWHLLKNLIDAGERLLQRQHAILRQAAQSVTAQRHARALSEETEPTTPPPAQVTRSTISRDRRLARYEEIRALYRQGMSLRAIVRTVGGSRRTIRQFAYAAQFPERVTPHLRGSCLDPFVPYLQRRWEAGCHNAAALWREIRAQGFRGTSMLVRTRVRQWRRLLPVACRRAQGTHGAPALLPFPQPSARTTVWWLLRTLQKKADPLTAEQQEFLVQLHRLSPAVAPLQTLILAFAQLLRERDGRALVPWVEAVRTSGLPELVSFANGLTRDWAAAQAACTSLWSNGQAEGQITRLKLLKRQMFGRANLDLLKARLLLAA